MIKNVGVLEALLKSLGHKHIKRISDTRLVVLIRERTVSARRSRLRLIAKQLKEQEEKFTYYPSHILSSSGVVIGYAKYYIFVNPVEAKKGVDKSFRGGLENESFLVKSINKHVKDLGRPISVRFISEHGKNFHIKSVKRAKNNREGGGAQRKADITVFDDSNTAYPISLKKDNAEFWENAQSYWGQNAKHIMDELLHRGDIKLMKRGGGTFDIAPKFAVKLNARQAQRVMFGLDVAGQHGRVIIRSFHDNDFHYDSSAHELVVRASFIFNRFSDVPSNKHPYFVVRYDRKSGGNNLLKGMRLEAVSPTRVSQEMIKIDSSHAPNLIRLGRTRKPA